MAGQVLDEATNAQLHGMGGRDVAGGRLVEMLGHRKHARMLAGAVVMERARRLMGLDEGPCRPTAERRVRAAFERVGPEPSAPKHALRLLHMPRLARMRGAAKRQLLVAEVERIGRAGLDQRQRLHQLHRRARIDRPRHITEHEQKFTTRAGDGDRSSMRALDEPPARDLDEDGVEHRHCTTFAIAPISPSPRCFSRDSSSSPAASRIG